MGHESGHPARAARIGDVWRRADRAAGAPADGIFADFGRRYGILGLAGFIEVSPQSLSCISIVAPPQRVAFDATHAALLQSIRPSVRRAIELHRRLSGAEVSSLQSAAVLDRLPYGVLLLDARRRVLSANPTADEMLRARDGLGAERVNLAGGTPDSTKTPHAALAAAVHLEPMRAGDTIGSALPRPSGPRALSLIIVPLPALRRVWVDDGARLSTLLDDP